MRAVTPLVTHTTLSTFTYSPTVNRETKFPLCQDIQETIKVHNSSPFWNAEFVGSKLRKCFSVWHF